MREELSGGRQRQQNRQFESSPLEVTRQDGAAMQSNSPFDDRQADAKPESSVSGVLRCPIEGFEDGVEVLRPNARPLDPHCNAIPSCRCRARTNGDAAPWRGVADRIANHILDGFAQQLPIPHNAAGIDLLQNDSPLTRRSLEGGIGYDAFEKLLERNRGAMLRSPQQFQA